jgi:uncharacterized protein
VTDLSALALNAAHQLPVSELHGIVCGLAVCHGEDLPLQELVDLVGVDALTDEASVGNFVLAAVRELEASDLSFAPLLPDDDADLVPRVEALGQWCGAFLTGLAAGLARRGVRTLDDGPAELREIVEDLGAIARIDTDSLAEPDRDDDEEAEVDLLELQEFVKVGVLLIMSVLGSESDDSAQ